MKSEANARLVPTPVDRTVIDWFAESVILASNSSVPHRPARTPSPWVTLSGIRDSLATNLTGDHDRICSGERINLLLKLDKRDRPYRCHQEQALHQLDAQKVNPNVESVNKLNAAKFLRRRLVSRGSVNGLTCIAGSHSHDRLRQPPKPRHPVVRLVL